MNATAAAGETRSPGVIKWFEGLLLVGMIVMCLSIVAIVLSKPAMGLVGNDDPVVDAEPSFPIDFGDQVPPMASNDGVPVATSQPPVKVGGPTAARFIFLAPSPAQRAVCLIWAVSGPLLIRAGLWLVYSIVRSARAGNPFVARNERRLWMLAALIAGGGTAYSFFSGVAAMLMFRGSTAAGLTETAFTISFLPIIVGSGVAALASVWHAGVALQDDVAGMI